MKRRGWTLHELLISLGVMGGVMALAAHAATTQLRFLTSAEESTGLRNQIEQAGAIAASVLWSVSSGGGDVVVALDSAIEVQMPVGASFVCGSSPGFVTIAAPVARGNTLAGFSATPGLGDRMLALFEDSVGATWLTLRPAAIPTPAPGCGHFPGTIEARTISLLEPIVVPPGAPIKFTRTVRLSLYRGSDKRWYLGSKEWNAEQQSFNSIQPVAGPLSPYSQDPDRTGLRFEYRDAEGHALLDPVATTRIASITIVARATTSRFEDSVSVMVALPNAR